MFKYKSSMGGQTGTSGQAVRCNLAYFAKLVNLTLFFLFERKNCNCHCPSGVYLKYFELISRNITS